MVILKKWRRPELDGAAFPSLSEEKNVIISRLFMEEEIKEVVL